MERKTKKRWVAAENDGKKIGVNPSRFVALIFFRERYLHLLDTFR